MKTILKKSMAIFLVFISLLSLGGCHVAPSPEKFDWDGLALSHKLPKPKMNSGVISSDNEECLIVRFYDVSKEYFQEYAGNCKSAGYSLDCKESTYLFEGRNSEGYQLKLEFHPNSDNRFMLITLDAPK